MKQRILFPRSRAQAGQALTEFIVVALALVPLFMIVPLIGKYQDISHKTQMASRYVAFEATTWNDSSGGSFKPEAQLADEVRRRFFSKTDDVAGDFDANRNSLWVDYKNKPMIGNFGTDVKVTFGMNGGVTHSDAFAPAPSPFLAQAGAVQTALGLKDKGIYTGEVGVTLAAISWPKIGLASSSAVNPLDTFQLAITRHTSVAIDPWPAKDSSSNAYGVEARINNPAIFPTGALGPISAALSPIVSTIDPGVLAPKLGQLEFWRDLVPEDRLK